ncbi:hypothetical protein D3C73_1212110 [compost metagenome]
MLAGGYERYAVERLAVAREVFFQGRVSQMRVTAADHRHVVDQAGGQRAEAVIEDQHSAPGRQLLSMQLLEQVFIGGVKGLQRVVGLVRLADQVEFGIGCDQQGHGIRLGHGSPVTDRHGLRYAILQGFASGRRPGY